MCAGSSHSEIVGGTPDRFGEPNRGSARGRHHRRCLRGLISYDGDHWTARGHGQGEDTARGRPPGSWRRGRPRRPGGVSSVEGGTASSVTSPPPRWLSLLRQQPTTRLDLSPGRRRRETDRSTRRPRQPPIPRPRRSGASRGHPRQGIGRILRPGVHWEDCRKIGPVL
jgi:hypothetical protein